MLDFSPPPPAFSLFSDADTEGPDLRYIIIVSSSGRAHFFFIPVLPTPGRSARRRRAIGPTNRGIFDQQKARPVKAQLRVRMDDFEGSELTYRMCWCGKLLDFFMKRRLVAPTCTGKGGGINFQINLGL